MRVNFNGEEFGVADAVRRIDMRQAGRAAARMAAVFVAVMVGGGVWFGAAFGMQFAASVWVESMGFAVPPQTFVDWAVFMGAQVCAIAGWWGPWITAFWWFVIRER